MSQSPKRRRTGEPGSITSRWNDADSDADEDAAAPPAADPATEPLPERSPVQGGGPAETGQDAAADGNGLGGSTASAAPSTTPSGMEPQEISEFRTAANAETGPSDAGPSVASDAFAHASTALLQGDRASHFPPSYRPRCRSVDKYEKISKIDEGTYGVVYKARDRDTGHIVALKQVKMVHAGGEGFPPTALRELNILLSLKHPHVINTREMVVGDTLDKIFMVRALRLESTGWRLMAADGG